MHISSLLYTYHTNLSHRISIDFDNNNIIEVNSSLLKRKPIITYNSKLDQLLSFTSCLNPRSVLFLLKYSQFLNMDDILSVKTDKKLKYISNVCFQNNKFISPNLINEILIHQMYTFSQGAPIDKHDVIEYIALNEINLDKEFKTFYVHRCFGTYKQHCKYDIKIAREFYYLSKYSGISNQIVNKFLKGF